MSLAYAVKTFNYSYHENALHMATIYAHAFTLKTEFTTSNMKMYGW